MMRILIPNVSVPKGDMNTSLGGGEDALPEMVVATRESMTTGEFGKSVTGWFRKPDSRRGLPGTERKVENLPPERDGPRFPP